jgi:hypothetical protein
VVQYLDWILDLGFASKIILSIKVKVLGGGFGLWLGENIAILSMVKRAHLLFSNSGETYSFHLVCDYCPSFLYFGIKSKVRGRDRLRSSDLLLCMFIREMPTNTRSSYEKDIIVKELCNHCSLCRGIVSLYLYNQLLICIS